MAKEEKTAKKDLVEILEVEGVDEANEIVLLLEKTLDLKTTIGVAPDEKKGTVGSGLLKDYDESKKQLAISQMTNGLDGLRHNKIVFTSRLQDGRSKFDFEKFCQYLVSHGVKVELISDGIREYTSTGDSFYVNEITELKK